MQHRPANRVERTLLSAAFDVAFAFDFCGRGKVGEQWEWSSFRSYLYQETGLVRVKFQEWPIEIKARPVAKFGEGRVMSQPQSYFPEASCRISLPVDLN